MTRTGGVRLAADEVSCARGKRVIVSSVDLDVPAGSRLALVGPNGAGKSTLLRVLAGLDSPVSGSVTVDCEDLHRMRSRQRARLIAVQGQEEAPSAELTLSEAVALGRTPHRTPWALGEEGEQAIVDQALHAVGLAGRGDQSCTRLSGGERHRVVLARTLAQRTPLLMLDEPTNHLDAAWRLRLMDALDTLRSTVVAAIHDLDLVLRYFDAVAVVHDGRVVAYGPPVETFTADLLDEVFGVRGDIIAHPRTGRPHLLIGDAVATTTESSTHP